MMVDFKEQEEKKKAVALDIVNTGLLFFRKYHLSTSGAPMSFEMMPYLKKIYFDENGKICVMSSVQTGKSELFLIKGLSSTDAGLNVFHVFSTREAKNSFVKSRIDELFDKVPKYREMEKDDRRNRYLRQIGNANWKFVISNSKSNFDEFPADVVIVDELDSCNQENVKLADTRLENSNYKFEWSIGNPSVKNTGISEKFEESTKNEWYFLCKECGKWMEADFFKLVVNEHKDKDGNHLAYELYDKEWNEFSDNDIRIRCIHCESFQDRGRGKWIEQEPRAKISGYHISKLMKLNSRVSELWIELKKAEGNNYNLQIFFNKKLGLPYAGTGANITNDMLDALVHTYYPFEKSSKSTIGGLDIGSKFDLQIDIPAKIRGQRKRLFLNAFRCNTLEEVKDMIELFNIKTLCVGIKPERHLVQTFREDMFGKCNVILIEELEGRSGNLKLIGFDEKEDLGVITVDRTWMMDETMKNIKLKRNILPKGYKSILDGYWLESMKSITRIFENDKEEYKWSKSDKDHFRFADAFSMLAWMKTQDAVLIGDGIKEEEKKKDHDEKGNRIIEDTKRTRRGIGIFKNRRGIGRDRERPLSRRNRKIN